MQSRDNQSFATTVATTIYRLPAKAPSRFAITGSGISKVASGSTRINLQPGHYINIPLAQTTSLSVGDYLVTMTLSETDPALLTAFMLAWAPSIAGSADRYPAGSAYVRGSLGNDNGGRTGLASPTPDEFVENYARLTNNALPGYIIEGPADMILMLTNSNTAADSKSNSARKACAKKRGYVWKSTTGKCVRK